MGNHPRHFMNEADIGSGDKTPADHETEQLIEEVGKAKKNADAQRGVKQDATKQQNSAATQKH
ncbi:MAG: hypothetical protein ACXU8A_06680 [Burkholderiaceae bacterium]